MSLLANKELIPEPFTAKQATLLVYKTDEENFIPYRSGDENTTEETDEEKTDEEETEEDTEETETDEDGFTLHQGKIIETYTFTKPYEISFGKDYEGLSGEGKVTMKFMKTDMPKIYKGVRCLLKVKRYNREDDPETVANITYLCFITDLTYSETGVEISLSAFEKLLEQEDKLTYTQMLRSKILEEVIKTAGLIPIVDPTGMKDEVIDWTSKSSSGEDDDSGGGDGSMTWDEAWEIAQSWVYGGWGSNHKPELAWSTMGKTKGHTADCFDASAWLYKVLNDFVGTPTRDVCGSGGGKSGTHHVVMCKKDGNWIFPEEYSRMTGNLKVSSSMRAGNYMVCRDYNSPDKYTCCKYGTC